MELAFPFNDVAAPANIQGTHKLKLTMSDQPLRFRFRIQLRDPAFPFPINSNTASALLAPSGIAVSVLGESGHGIVSGIIYIFDIAGLPSILHAADRLGKVVQHLS